MNKKENKKFNDRKKRIRKITRILKRLYGDKPQIALKYNSSWQLLVSVILSAQCTDKKVNMVTKELFKKYKKIDDYVNINIKKFEKDIKPTGFYKNKAKNILSLAKVIKNEYNGKIPKSISVLIKLPGIGRKTANVVLSHAFGIVEGVVVDTHVRRFTFRFDLSDSLDATKIEEDLMKLLPKKDWVIFSDFLIKYGREICPAKIHACESHPLTITYPQAQNRWVKNGNGIILK